MGLRPIRIYYGWLVLVSWFVVSTAISGVGLHLVPHLIQQGLDPLQAVGFVSVMFIYFALLALVSSALILAARPPNQRELS